MKPRPEPEGPIRLNKYIAQTGLCSRRKADELIAAGQVLVDGEVVKEMGTKVTAANTVVVNGTRIEPESLLYLLLNKPEDTITTTDDEKGRKTVLDLVDLPDESKVRLYPVGRLDRNTTGVLLLTNDGDLAHRLMHPSFEIQKLYRVKTRESVKPHQIDLLRNGIELDDGPAKADHVAYIDPPNHHEIGMEIHEGRNRQVRRMMEALGHEVAQLERVRYAGLSTEGVRRGKWRRLEGKEIRQLRRKVKLNSR
ncbi:MAG: pseudouridine synthase [Rhodothermales bacterium]